MQRVEAFVPRTHKADCAIGGVAPETVVDEVGRMIMARVRQVCLPEGAIECALVGELARERINVGLVPQGDLPPGLLRERCDVDPTLPANGMCTDVGTQADNGCVAEAFSAFVCQGELESVPKSTDLRDAWDTRRCARVMLRRSGQLAGRTMYSTPRTGIFHARAFGCGHFASKALRLVV